MQLSQSVLDNGIHAFYYGETKQNEAILTFRGTLPPSLAPGSDVFQIVLDWLNDDNVAWVKGQDLEGRVHKGFLEASVLVLYRTATRARATSAWVSQKGISIVRYISMAVESAARTCSGRPLLAYSVPRPRWQ